MTKKTKSDLLRPYAAFMLFEEQPTSPGTSLDLKKLANALKKEPIKGTAEAEVQAQVDWNPSTATACFAVHYSRTTQVAWSKDPDIQDVSHHLLLLISHAGYLGVATSDSDLREKFGAALRSRKDLKALSSSALENAFVHDRELLTLWLSATHRSSPYKADSKVLIGKRLQSALNPLDDRTFRASSVRAATDAGAVASGISKIGVSPKKAYAWLGPTKDIANFVSRFQALIGYLTARSVQINKPPPILARPLQTAITKGDVHGAFDFGFISHLTLPDADVAIQDALERFELSLAIETVGSNADHNFELLVLDQNAANLNRSDKRWRVGLDIDLGVGSVVPTLASDSSGWPTWSAGFELLLKAPSLWSVWYETGEALTGGEWTSVDARASSYEGEILGVKFAANWDLSAEKPQVGQGPVIWSQVGHDNSLFSWWVKEGLRCCFPTIKRMGPGEFAYLVCDDGSNEFADFIILAKHSSFRSITNPSDFAIILTHIKGASKATNRQMAPKMYEEVLGQCIKSLGRASFPEASDYMLERLKNGKATLWKWNGKNFIQTLARGTMLPATDPAITDFDLFQNARVHTEVVVLQPHQSKASFETAMQLATVEMKTKMMCTMLCAADGAARASAARFRVIMSA